MPVAAPAVPEGAVACVGDRIVGVGPAAALTERFPGAAGEDLGDAILVPGLVDAHCHLEWSLLEGLLPPAGFGTWLGRFLPLRARIPLEDHRIAARHGALRALRAGTTTLADSGPTGSGAAAMAEVGLRGAVHLEAFGTPEGEDARREAASVAARVAALDAEAGPGLRVGLSPHAPYTVGPAFWRALDAEPELAGRPWATHLAESEDEDRVVARGEGPLAEAFAAAGFAPGRWDGAGGETIVARVARAGGLREGLVAAHCVRLGEADPATLRDAGVGVAHCPRSNEYLLTGPAPVAAMRAAGLAVGLGTDSPASGGDYDVRAEARACARVHGGGMAAAELLRMATLGGAEALGLGHEVGSLTPGKRADLVALRPAAPADDPAEAAMAAATAVGVVVASGEVVVSGGSAARRGRRGHRCPGSRGSRAALVASRAVLLDQKRTRRTVQVVAILTSIAFAGVIFVVLGLIFFGGGGESAEDQILNDAIARVENEPRNPEAYEELASAYAAKADYPQAIAAARRAVALEPDDLGRVQVLVSLQLQAGQAAAAVASLQDYTARNPEDAEAFLQLGQQAEQAGRTQLAQLAYQTFLRLEPDDPNAEAVQDRLNELSGAGTGTTTGGG